MKTIFESKVENVEKEEDYSVDECVKVFMYSNEDEIDDFSILNHNEQIETLGLEKETSTPDKTHASVIRHFIDASDAFVVVRSTKTTW